VWRRIVSLPLFSSMRGDEVETVIDAVRAVCGRFRTTVSVTAVRV